MKMGVWSMLLWACVEPARSPLGAPAPLPPQVFTQECNGLRVQVTLDHRYQNAALADVVLTDAAGSLPADIGRVVLAFTPQHQRGATTTLVARLSEAGHYAPASALPLTPGPWTLEVIVYRTTGRAVTCVFSLNL
jgi:hypothetical protein